MPSPTVDRASTSAETTNTLAAAKSALTVPMLPPSSRRVAPTAATNDFVNRRLAQQPHRGGARFGGPQPGS
jgi:hypothetical protein